MELSRRTFFATAAALFLPKPETKLKWYLPWKPTQKQIDFYNAEKIYRVIERRTFSHVAFGWDNIGGYFRQRAGEEPVYENAITRTGQSVSTADVREINRADR